MKDTRFHKGAFVAALALITLLLAAGCDNAGNPFKRGDQQCIITPQLKKALKEYDWVSVDKYGMVRVSSHKAKKNNDGKLYNPCGCLDLNGNTIVPVKYEGVEVASKSVVFVKENGKWLKLDVNNNRKIPIDIDKFRGRDWDCLIVQYNGKLGVIDTSGNMIVPPQYDNIYSFYPANYHTMQYNPDKVFVLMKDGEKEIVNLTRDGFFKAQEHVQSPYDILIVEKNGKYGFVNYLGEKIPYQYENARPKFSEGLVAVVKNHKVGFINEKGRVMIPFKFYYSEFIFNYTELTSAIFNEGMAAMVDGNGKWGFIDKQGNTAIPYVYDWADYFHQGAALVSKKMGGQTLLGMIDKNDKVIVPFEYENGAFSENVFILCKNGKWGAYTPMGTCIVPCEYERQFYFFAGYATVELNGKQGLIDEQGRLLIPCEYETASHDWSVDLVFVKQNGKTGYVDLQNQVVVPIEFNVVGPCEGFNGNLFVVEKDGRYGLYDRCGNCTLD